MGRTRRYLQLRTKHTISTPGGHGSLANRRVATNSKYYQNKGQVTRQVSQLTKQHEQQMQSQMARFNSLETRLQKTNEQAKYWEDLYATSEHDCGKATLSDDSDSVFDGSSVGASEYECDTNVNKPNNYFKYDNDIIMGVIEMRSAGVSAASIPHVIEVVLRMYNVYDVAKQQHSGGFIPSSSTIRNYVTYYAQKCSDIQLAMELHDGEFSNDGHAMIRDGSSYYGRHIEALVICTQNKSYTADVNEQELNVQSPKPRFITRLLTIPQIAAKDSTTIGETLYEDIKWIDNYSRELYDDFGREDTILNQFSEFMTDGLTGEQLVTDFLASKQTKNIDNTRYKCLQHGLNALCENGIKKYLHGRNNPFGDNLSKRDIFYLLMVLCKLFGNEDYSHNRRDDFRMFCDRSNVKNQYSTLPKFPVTRVFHSLKLIVNCVSGLPHVENYLQQREHTWQTEYKGEIAVLVHDFDLIRQSLFATLWNDCFFLLLERYWINSSVDFKNAARKFLQSYYELRNLTQGQSSFQLFMYTCGLKTFGSRMQCFNTDHALYTVLNDIPSIDRDLNCKFKNVNVDFVNDDFMNELDQISIIRICIASVLYYLDDDNVHFLDEDDEFEDVQPRTDTVCSLIEILFDDTSMINIQSSYSSKLEYCIFQRFGANYLASLWFETSIMFQDSIKYVLQEFDKKVKELKFNASLSQDFLGSHNYASNVPASSCFAEGIFGEFKQLASRCKQMKHKQNAALQQFKTNQVWKYYSKLQMTNPQLYHKAIKLLVSDSVRKCAKQQKAQYNKMAQATYDRQTQKEAERAAQKQRTDARIAKILQHDEIESKTSLDAKLDGKTASQKFTICKIQLQIHKVKYDRKICTFSIKDGDKRKNKKWPELYDCLINILDSQGDNPDETSGSDSDRNLWCVCREECIEGQFMIECGICHEWYHPDCINMTDSEVRHYRSRFWCCNKNKNMSLTCFQFSTDEIDNDPEWNDDSNESGTCIWVEINKHIENDDEINNILSWSPEIITQSMNQGSGIKNLGNSCFMNAILQCLAYTPALYQYCQMQIQAGIRRCDRHVMNQFCCWNEVLPVFEQLVNHSPEEDCVPANIFNNLPKIAGLQSGLQHDAHEFLRQLLDKIKYCQQIQHGEETDEKQINADESNNTTMVDLIFGGCFKKNFECLKCNHITPRFDSFHDISLELAGASLYQCLDNHFASEKLTKDNKRGCNQCSRKRDTNCTTSIFEPPNILVIHLKRFRFDRIRSKISTFVKFPRELNMSKYCDPSNPANWSQDGSQNISCNYTLYATATHHGERLRSGHYTCNVKTPNNKWLYKSDRTVYAKTESNVLNDIQSLLFYKRQKQRKNSIMHRFFKAWQRKEFENEDTNRCVACGDAVDESEKEHCGCGAVYDWGCVEWANDGSVICKICTYYDDYE